MRERKEGEQKIMDMEIEISGVVNKIARDSNTRKNYFELQLNSASASVINRATVKCIFFMNRVKVKMPCLVKGYFKGEYFYVTELKLDYSDYANLISYIKLKVSGSGVGKRTIGQIIQQFGVNFLNLDSQTMYKTLVENFKGKISHKQANEFVSKWSSTINPVISELEETFIGLEVEDKHIEKIYEHFSDTSITELKKNPYIVCILADIKEYVADAVAYKIGIKALDDIRIAGLIRYSLMSFASQGHTCVPAWDLVKQVRWLASKSLYNCYIPLACISNVIAKNAAFTWDTTDNTIALTKLRNEELNIANKLIALNKNCNIRVEPDEDIIDDIEDELGTKYSDEQRQAFNISNSTGVSFLIGGPGTGKTTLVKGLVIYYKMLFPDGKMIFCAPTGAAAKRLSSSVGLPAETIHSTVGIDIYSSAESYPKYNEITPLDCDFLICDETSMCDVETLSMLLNAIPLGCKVLFVGDENQLQSVGAGNCLHDMTSSNLFDVFRLIKNFRSDGDGTIIDNAQAILKGNMPKQADDFNIIRANSDSHAYYILGDILKQEYCVNDPYRCQLIEPSKKGSAGCDAMNSFMHKYVHSYLGDKVSNDFMVDDKIMFLYNNRIYSSKHCDEHGNKIPILKYVNGEVGKIESIIEPTNAKDTEDGGNVTISTIDGKIKKITLTELSDCQLAYAYTIHKSQGSENEVIIIYLSGAKNVKQMMNRNLLYTAITRAKKKVYLVHSGDALRSCINNEFAVIRRTKLCDFLLVA